MLTFANKNTHSSGHQYHFPEVENVIREMQLERNFPLELLWTFTQYKLTLTVVKRMF